MEFWILLLLTLPVLWASSFWLSLRRNIAVAKQTELPYIIVPIWFRFLPWFLLQEDFIPLLNKLPRFLREPWLSAVVFGRAWNYGYEPFEKVGDTFLTVSPGGVALLTCDPAVSSFIFSRPREFPKPVELLDILNVYGPALTATEGELGRKYRKIAAPSFNEATHRAVWNCSLSEAAVVEGRWRVSVSAKPTSMVSDITRMSLHVISSAGLGKNMDWTDDEGHSGTVPEGHALSFSEAITQGLASMGTIYGTPKWLLSASLTQAHKAAFQAYTEWIKYMEEMRDEKQAELRHTLNDSTLNLLGAVVQASNFEGRQASGEDDNDFISPEAVLGNLFILTFAGHDTSANILTFALYVLAYFPRMQKRLQQEFDEILGSRSPRDWSYADDLSKLMNGYLGGIFNETLRNYTVLPAIFKSTGSEPRTLVIGERPYTLPADVSNIMINTSASHRHPKFWPELPTRKEPGESAPYPLSGFRPEMWLDANFAKNIPEGAWMPFSSGPRACMGQRFAKVQFCSIVARLLAGNSLELDVPTADAQYRELDRASQWAKARAELAHQLSGGVEVRLAMKMIEKVKLRLVKRGEERWADCY